MYEIINGTPKTFHFAHTRSSIENTITTQDKCREPQRLREEVQQKGPVDLRTGKKNKRFHFSTELINSRFTTSPQHNIAV
jgi:hypothetical protein